MAVKEKAYDITTDGRTVWVNAASCLGRFGLQGIDIHRPAAEQPDLGECLYCTHGPTTRADWDVFVAKMLEHHAIKVLAKYMPKRFR
jgi:hypothetical protein